MADDTSLIPPTPSSTDYAGSRDRPLIADSEDPLELFAAWMAEARAHEPDDANAMTLATADAQGWPDARIVLLKDFSAEGFTFYTNLTSAKANQLAANGAAALLFFWKSVARQVRLRGHVVSVEAAAADAYFAERARESQIGAWASDQSQPLADREALAARVALLTDLHRDDERIERPPYWGGYRLVPHSIEFWQAQAFRLHDRKVYTRGPDGESWSWTRLNP